LHFSILAAACCINGLNTYLFCSEPTKEPYISSKEPYISSEEPYISSKEPYISSKEP